MKTLLITLVSFAGALFLGWLGLQIKPAPFPPYPEESPALKTIPVPESLPKPVQRFYRAAYGERIPVVETAVIGGRASMNVGIRMPARFLFVHNAGKDYRHYFETTWFNLALMKVNENYVDGKSYFELPFATYEDDPSINQGANLAVWAEAAWFPSVWVTDPRVRWQEVDDHAALMFVPFGDKEENFILRFDPETGLLDTMEAMRYRDTGPQAKKILWITKNLPGKTIPGTNLPAVGSAIWLDQGEPWATFTLEEVKFNVDVREYIRKRGQ